VMVTTPAIRDYIADAHDTPLIAKAIGEGASYGMQTFDQAILGLLDQQLVTRDEAFRWLSNGEDFARRQENGPRIG
jgi:twitching motility protein PilT